MLRLKVTDQVLGLQVGVTAANTERGLGGSGYSWQTCPQVSHSTVEDLSSVFMSPSSPLGFEEVNGQGDGSAPSLISVRITEF